MMTWWQLTAEAFNLGCIDVPDEGWAGLVLPPPAQRPVRFGRL
jgi:hypothetical protein